MSAFSTWLARRSLNGGWPAEAEQFQGQAVAGDFFAGTQVRVPQNSVFVLRRSTQLCLL